MKAIELLKDYRNIDFGCDVNDLHTEIDEAIKELEELQSNIDASIEEIEYALAKPIYADVYLNNALRYLKEESKWKT